MSLRKRIILTLLGVVLGYVALSHVILNAVVAPALSDLERRLATTNLARVEQAILADLNNLSTTNTDWSEWDDTYAFVLGSNPGYVESNLVDTTLPAVNLDLMLFFDKSGEIVWAKLLDPVTHETLLVEELLATEPFQTGRLVLHADLDSEVSGILQSTYGPMLVSSRPVLTSEQAGPIAGALVVGRFLDSAELGAIRVRTEVDFATYPAASGLPSELEAVAAELQRDAEPVLRRERVELLSYALLEDVSGLPALLVQVRTPRDITALSARTVDLALLFLLLAGVVLMAALGFLLQRFILTPLSTLTRHILHIRESGDLSVRVAMQRADEIGTLAGAFDTMANELEMLRRKLVEQSFKSGMAETAAGVMHDIRNTMTPLVNRIARARENLSEVRERRLEQALTELRHDISSERRGKLLEYARLAFQRIAEVQATAGEDLAVASQHAARVEQVLAAQEPLTRQAMVLERVGLDDVVTAAVESAGSSAAGQPSVEIDGSLHDRSVLAHRLNLVEVLGNVLATASAGIRRSGRSDGRISLAAESATLRGQAVVRLRVRDNGAGFESDEMTAIFTRSGGSSPEDLGGRGLHWCANTITRMGGTMTASSDGPGRGAEFQIVLPAAAGAHEHSEAAA